MIEYIVPLSGGLDSTYLLYKMLSEKKKVNVFHVSIIHNAENRWQQELTATQSIVKWLVSKFGEFRMDYVRFDMRQIPVGHDTDQILLVAQKITYRLIKNQETSKIILCHGIVADDNDLSFVKKRNALKGIGTASILWNALLDSMFCKVKKSNQEKIDKNISYPLSQTYKSEILKKIPKPLLSMVWYCRRNINGNPCGKCESCRLHEKSVKDAFK